MLAHTVRWRKGCKIAEQCSASMCKSKPLRVTLKRCRELFEICEPSDLQKESGLKWKVNRRGGKAKAGDWAGCLNHNVSSGGEIRKVWRVKIDGKDYLVARIIYFMVHGVDPYPMEVDHINRDSRDNRVENLRLGDRQLQGQNTSIRKDNESGITGVCWVKEKEKWHSYIYPNSKRINLGYFATKKEAAAARNEGVKKYFMKEAWDAKLVDLDTITN